MQKVGLLFDCVRSPYDVAHIFQVATALDNCNLYFSGNSIDLCHKKITSKVKSWGIKNIPEYKKFESLEEAADCLHKKEKYLIGTSPNAKKDLYSFDFTLNDSILVFGNESSGLSWKKINLLDDLMKVPMKKDCKFLTLPTVVPIVAYELYRQISGGQNGKSQR